jgi:hypothetical protein
MFNPIFRLWESLTGADNPAPDEVTPPGLQNPGEWYDPGKLRHLMWDVDGDVNRKPPWVAGRAGWMQQGDGWIARYRDRDREHGE